MSYNCFSFLMRFLEFDDKETQPQRWREDKFVVIRNFFNETNERNARYWNPSPYINVSETLYPYRRRIGMKQYDPSKHAKYESLNIEVYVMQRFPIYVLHISRQTRSYWWKCLSSHWLCWILLFNSTGMKHFTRLLLHQCYISWMVPVEKHHHSWYLEVWWKRHSKGNKKSSWQRGEKYSILLFR